MKKAIIVTTASILFSGVAMANSGLADRVNEARSYPKKIISEVEKKTTCRRENKCHINLETSTAKDKKTKNAK
ncbi:MAG: hypothetical protein HUJ18_00750 [Marinobacter sp.]|nr:hypothetical protein [Marinobacter sp.]